MSNGDRPGITAEGIRAQFASHAVRFEARGKTALHETGKRLGDPGGRALYQEYVYIFDHARKMWDANLIEPVEGGLSINARDEATVLPGHRVMTTSAAPEGTAPASPKALKEALAIATNDAVLVYQVQTMVTIPQTDIRYTKITAVTASDVVIDGHRRPGLSIVHRTRNGAHQAVLLTVTAFGNPTYAAQAAERDLFADHVRDKIAAASESILGTGPSADVVLAQQGSGGGGTRHWLLPAIGVAAAGAIAAYLITQGSADSNSTPTDAAPTFGGAASQSDDLSLPGPGVSTATDGSGSLVLSQDIPQVGNCVVGSESIDSPPQIVPCGGGAWDMQVDDVRTVDQDGSMDTCRPDSNVWVWYRPDGGIQAAGNRDYGQTFQTDQAEEPGPVVCFYRAPN